MRIPIAKEGRGLVGATLAGSLMLVALGGRYMRRVGLAGIAASAGLATMLRDPDLIVIPFENGVLAPADGRITRIETAPFTAHGAEPMRKVTISAGLLDCHILRAPISGRVTHKPGAGSADARASDFGCFGEFPVFLRNRSAVSAESVMAKPNVGDTIEQGDRIGLVKFGTTCEIYFPLEFSLLRNVGDRTIAGVTALAQAREIPDLPAS